MKKMFLAVAAVAVAAAVPATAQTGTTVTGTANGSIDVPLSGTLAKKCILSSFLNGPFDALNLETTAVQGAESLSLNCNYGGTASVTFSSANGGAMKSGANSLPYNFILSGSPLSSGVSLATAQTWGGFPAVTNSAQTRSMSVQLTSAATVAGTYTDTVTVAVQPN
ncbi:spore coat protein U domain-containing protein [Sphingopyxis sp.]|uniref:spore coat protein U domain-containing protein n=1 Tax=Sphingopyxis sp. TaxID=1908224 RepID=UPI001D2A48D2|nr:spore coat protein U domain-containing protein [Sphingopyxis sp.]MBW8296717.1 spore coat protein U domain-containing protein [Sphingopyxis sp.]